MLEAARQTIDVFAGVVATDHGFQPVGTRLEWKVKNALTKQFRADYQQGMVDALNAWSRENNGSYVNGLAKMIWHACAQNGSIPVRDQFEAPLSDVMENLVKDLSEDRDVDMRQFLSRASRHPQPFVWDRKEGIFH